MNQVDTELGYLNGNLLVVYYLRDNRRLPRFIFVSRNIIPIQSNTNVIPTKSLINKLYNHCLETLTRLTCVIHTAIIINRYFFMSQIYQYRSNCVSVYVQVPYRHQKRKTRNKDFIPLHVCYDSTEYIP